jgi:hypothetical protein
LTSSCSERGLSIPIQPGNCHEHSLSSESMALSSAHLFGMFRDFRHHILPCQRDGNRKPASVLLLKVSWWQLDLCKSYLGLYARSRQSQHFSKYGCTPQMTGLAPFGPLSGISLARHKVTILFVPCCTNPFILLFGTSLLPSWQSHVA